MSAHTTFNAICDEPGCYPKPHHHAIVAHDAEVCPVCGKRLGEERPAPPATERCATCGRSYEVVRYDLGVIPHVAVTCREKGPGEDLECELLRGHTGDHEGCRLTVDGAGFVRWSS